MALIPCQTLAVTTPTIAILNFPLQKLTKDIYLLWKTQCLPLLRDHNMLDLVDGTEPCPSATNPTAMQAIQANDSEALLAAPATPNPTYAAWVKKDQQVLD